MEHLILKEREGYTIVQLNRGKVNALNHDMVEELRDTIKVLEGQAEVKGVILTGQPHFFSAGLDLVELIQYDRKKMTSFFVSFGALYNELQRFKKPLIAAITGHCPAGGCVIAVACDNRYMTLGDKYVIGLNEVAVNIQISQNLTEAYAFWMGHGRAHRYIMEGKLLSGNEALKAGLVDELLPLEEVLPRAEKQMQKYLRADQEILINTKQKLRKPLWDALDPNPQSALAEAIALWWKPEIQEKMHAYVASFTNKKKT